MTKNEPSHIPKYKLTRNAFCPNCKKRSMSFSGTIKSVKTRRKIFVCKHCGLTNI